MVQNQDLTAEFDSNCGLEGAHLTFSFEISNLLSVKRAGLAPQLLLQVLFGEMVRPSCHLGGDTHHEVPSRLKWKRPDSC
jgi:hypothetical protein